METTIIIKGHPWKPQDPCSHWLPWNGCSFFLLCLCKAGHWGGVLFMPPSPPPTTYHYYPNLSTHYYPNLSTHLSRTAPHRNCQKRFPSLLGAPPYSPRMTLPFKVLFNWESFLHPKVNTLPWQFIWFSKMILNKYLLQGRERIIFSLEQKEKFQRREAWGGKNKTKQNLFWAPICPKTLF